MATYIILGIIIWWVITKAPPSGQWIERKERERENRKIDARPNTLEPEDDPWHPDYKGPKLK